MLNFVCIFFAASVMLAPIFFFTIYFLPEKHARIQAWMPALSSGSMFGALLLMLPFSLKGYIFENSLLQFIPDIKFYFRIDLFGLYFGLVTTLIWFIVSIYSIGYMKDEKNLCRFYCFFVLCLYFTLGIAFSGNLFTLFIFYELVTLCGYPLIIHEETDEARKASRKYLYYTLTGDAFVLFSIFMAYRVTGSTDIRGAGINGIWDMFDFYLLMIFTILGFVVKASLMPLHGWVADAHPAAPSPASAILSGVLVNVGIFGMARIFYNIIGHQILIWSKFSMFLLPVVFYTIIAASVIALNQNNLKRRLAYSTIGQLSYIVFGLLLANENGITGGLVHIANHALMKGTLFLCAGVIIKETGIKNISDMKGVAKRVPITMIVFTIAALGMIGTPPLCGFISKWTLGVGALDANKPLYIAVLLASSLLAAGYFLPIIFIAFFQKQDIEKLIAGPEKWYKECDRHMLISIITGGILIILFGIYVLFPGSPFDLSSRIAKLWTQIPK
ncbi:hypothetical protein HY745_08060 [Candidatus Desantisbacteria bacterium]|nr:hypothetical protein [Candidatus Desantisbacteria bacterium]